MGKPTTRITITHVILASRIIKMSLMLLKFAVFEDFEKQLENIEKNEKWRSRNVREPIAKAVISRLTKKMFGFTVTQGRVRKCKRCQRLLCAPQIKWRYREGLAHTSNLSTPSFPQSHPLEARAATSEGAKARLTNASPTCSLTEQSANHRKMTSDTSSKAPWIDAEPHIPQK